MEVPVEDFGHLARELSCSLHRTADTLTLASEQPGCALHFKLEGPHARLDAVEVSNDPDGHFFRDVVGLVMQLYCGDLEAELTWSPRGAMENRVLVRAGETTHPLLYQGEARSPDELPVLVDENTLAKVEAWLVEAKLAWAEYHRLKSQPEA
jgi:hypothetical protein